MVNHNKPKELEDILFELQHSKEEVEKDIIKLKEVFRSKSADKSAAIAALSSIIKGFKHIETGKSLDQKTDGQRWSISP